MSEYQTQANEFCKNTNTKITFGEPTYKDHFDDGQLRWVFPVTISRNGQRMRVQFGQSIANGSQQPTAYDVLSCLQKYEVGTFEQFASAYGFDLSRKSRKVYNACSKEYDGVDRLFSDVIEELREIV